MLFKGKPREQVVFENEVDGPIPGQTFTNRPGRFPFERPPSLPHPEDVVQRIVQSLARPEKTAELLSLMENGVAVDTIVEQIAKTAFDEGVTSANAAMLIVPSIAVLLIRMAEAAGIDFEVTSNPNVNKATETEVLIEAMRRHDKGLNDNNAVAKAVKAGEQSQDELASATNKLGLIKRPVEELV